MKQYRMQPGTSPRIYYVLTVMDDETMTLTFHGTDREMTEVVTTREDGWIVTPRGGLYPPVSHNRWQEQEAEEETEVRTGEIVCDPTPTPSPARDGNGCASRSRRRRNSGHADTSDIDAARNQGSADSHQPSKSLWPAAAAFAAACVGLVVIYESGLLIPAGLIGAVAGGVLR